MFINQHMELQKDKNHSSLNQSYSKDEPLLSRQPSNTSDAAYFGALPADNEVANTAPKDNRMKAILFMNLYAIGAISQSVIFKIASAAGAQVIDYQVFRNLGLLFVAGIELTCL